MDEYINRDAFMEDIEKRYCDPCPKNGTAGCLACWINDMVGEVGDAPFYDDLEFVVRCKDCRYARNWPHGLCYLHTEPYDNAQGYKGEAVCIERNDFCSSGERRKTMESCKYLSYTGICVNGDCPCVADYCPCTEEYLDICKYAEEGECDV